MTHGESSGLQVRGKKLFIGAVEAGGLLCLPLATVAREDRSSRWGFGGVQVSRGEVAEMADRSVRPRWMDETDAMRHQKNIEIRLKICRFQSERERGEFDLEKNKT